MEVEILKVPTDEDWLAVRNAALETQRKSSNKVPNGLLKTKFLFSEHSPIRVLEYSWRWIDLPSWTSVHFVRHHEGITHFVSSQRNDIQKLYDRRKAPQDTPVNHRCFCNAQELLNISKARKCINASLETRQAWQMFLDALQPLSPEIVSLAVKPCVYRNGICPEIFKPCGFNHTNKFKQELDDYLNIYNLLMKKENAQ